MRNFLLMTTCLVVLLTGCGSSQVTESEFVSTEPISEYEEVEKLDIHTELLMLYYPDGSKEEIVFEWKDKTEESIKGTYRICYYNEPIGPHLYSNAVCIANGGVVYYKTESNDELQIFSGTFTLETVATTN